MSSETSIFLMRSVGPCACNCLCFYVVVTLLWFYYFFSQNLCAEYSTITSADIRVLLGDQDVKGVMSKLSTWLWNKIILYSSRSVFFSKHLLVEGMRARINYSLWRQEFGGFFIMTKGMPVQKVKNKRLV